jgi:hypothetical protein
VIACDRRSDVDQQRVEQRAVRAASDLTESRKSFPDAERI